MRVVITGGSGLIGRALSASLARDHHEVIILSRHPEQVVGLPAVVRAERWNPHIAEECRHLVEEADAVVNLAGENIAARRWTVDRKKQIRDSRLNAGRAMLQALESATRKPRVVIQASAVGYYGLCGDEELNEESPPGKDFLAQLAIDWEASTAQIERLGVRRAIIRTGVILSPEGGAFPRLLLPFRLFVGGPLGSGRQWFPWIHIADEVGAIRFLLENESASGPFNLSAPHPVTNADFARMVGRQTKRPAFLPTPAFLLRLLFGEMATVLLDGQRAFPGRLMLMGYNFRFP
ncbi:MAG: TIGR01777 family protein, partial [Chloroflexi bacterium RBG_13_53_26]